MMKNDKFKRLVKAKVHRLEWVNFMQIPEESRSVSDDFCGLLAVQGDGSEAAKSFITKHGFRHLCRNKPSVNSAKELNYLQMAPDQRWRHA